jgi:hypothetical protein
MADPKNVHPGKRSIVAVLPFVLAMILMLSCTIMAPAATPTPTNTNTPEATNTPLPTNTPQPTATKKKATPNKAATDRAKENMTATAEAEWADAVLGEVETKLDEVGVIMGYGSVIWLYPAPIEIESSKHNMIYYQLLNQSIEAGDFAFHTNIKWETRGNVGIVYCVIMFRIGDDINMDPWYSLSLQRISGYSKAGFDLWQNWSILGGGLWKVSNYIRDGNGDENEVILVAQGTQYTVYINTHSVNVWWNTKVQNGGFGLGTLQDVGTTTCTYSDNWIWEWE